MPSYNIFIESQRQLVDTAGGRFTPDIESQIDEMLANYVFDDDWVYESLVLEGLDAEVTDLAIGVYTGYDDLEDLRISMLLAIKSSSLVLATLNSSTFGVYQDTVDIGSNVDSFESAITVFFQDALQSYMQDIL